MRRDGKRQVERTERGGHEKGKNERRGEIEGSERRGSEEEKVSLQLPSVLHLVEMADVQV